MKLIVDPSRRNLGEGGTGIYVRANDGGDWVSTDILCLDKASILTWLRSRGGDNPWAEDTVGILLGYGPLHQIFQWRRVMDWYRQWRRDLRKQGKPMPLSIPPEAYNAIQVTEGCRAEIDYGLIYKGLNLLGEDDDSEKVPG